MTKNNATINQTEFKRLTSMAAIEYASESSKSLFELGEIIRGYTEKLKGMIFDQDKRAKAMHQYEELLNTLEDEREN